MHTEIIPHENKWKKYGACLIRASLVCNATCVHIPASTWLSPRASQSWDAVTCPSSLDQREGRSEGTQSELSFDCWCSLLSPQMWQELLGHLRTALQGVLLYWQWDFVAWRGERDDYRTPCLCYCPHHRKSHLGNYQILLREGDLLSANIRDVIDALS